MVGKWGQTERAWRSRGRRDTLDMSRGRSFRARATDRPAAARIETKPHVDGNRLTSGIRSPKTIENHHPLVADGGREPRDADADGIRGDRPGCLQPEGRVCLEPVAERLFGDGAQQPGPMAAGFDLLELDPRSRRLAQD